MSKVETNKEMQEIAQASNPLAAHDPQATEHWHAGGDTGSNLRDLVLGISDGLVTVIAFVAGTTALLQGTNLVLKAGVAEMFAGAVSMGLGAYLGSKSQREVYEKEKAREYYEVEHMPEMERQEVRDIYSAKGFSDDDLEMIVARITSDKDRWVNMMMSEELGYGDETNESPTRTGAIVGVSYMIGALVPLSPYIIHRILGIADTPTALNITFITSAALTLAVLFAFGTFKSRFTHQAWWRSGLEMLVAGGAGALIVYGIGHLIEGLIS
jgi:vacuolar iron transporter family protein